MAIKDNIKRYRLAAKISQPQLAKLCGWDSQSRISNYETGTRDPSTNDLKKIANALKISVMNLINEKKNELNQDLTDYETESRNISIPQYDAIGAMGDGVLLRDQSGIICEWQVSEDWVQKNIKGYTSIKNICLVTGFGDSMKGLYNSGDPLIMDKGIITVDHDGVYFFRVGNEGFIKRLQRIPGKGIRVISDNKNYEAWDVTEDMDFEVFGKIHKAWQGVDL